ncbi:CHAT domain-containing protein, partial [Actinoplanes sp. NPDC048791]|uniref:CHAT domain-containing protein n=1 Tax=Actinoplanes sp. NPDC048791 TaxID=3154623 RepID=UPI0033EDFB77
AIRQLPGFRDFLYPSSVAGLRRQSGPGVVVMVCVSDLGSYALLVTAREIRSVPLPAVSAYEVGRLTREYYQAIRTAAHEVTRTVLAWLWDHVAEPVLTELGITGAPVHGWPRLWWAATGVLGLLPLHAAGRPEPGGHRTVLDRVVSSYTPTVRALAYARRDGAETDGDASTLVVPMPRTRGGSDLPGSEAETALIAGLRPAGTTVLAPADAHRDRILAELPRHARVHFACHATNPDPRHPSAAALEVTGGRARPLSVLDVTRLRLTGELAFLSACSTANAGEALADEAIHLASAFQLAGYRHVIGTLWPVRDAVAGRVTGPVYDGIAAAGTADAAPVALHHAVRALRRRYPDRPALWATHVHSGS